MGYPTEADEKMIAQRFANPPKGYGQVPFFWWEGDSLTKERLAFELDKLKEASIAGFSISYTHTHPDVDHEINANGYGGFGKADPFPTNGGICSTGLPKLVQRSKWGLAWTTMS